MTHSSPKIRSGGFGLIGGSGLTCLAGLNLEQQHQVETPYGSPSAPIEAGHFHDYPVYFLPRHGIGHRLCPHEINYRANIDAFRQMGVTRIIGVNAVGGISSEAKTGSIVIPDQLIDYTWGREATFAEAGVVNHIDFTYPYSEPMRAALERAANRIHLPIVNGGVHGVMQGPRLETAAEINRLERDGCTVVGMTGMPEAALAREAGIEYACVLLVVNPAAGRSRETISMQAIQQALTEGMGRVLKLIGAYLDAERD